MNVLVLNEQQNQLQNLEVDIIKSISGCFEASEIAAMFKNFYFNKMIIDVTALKGYDMPITYKTIADELNPDKVIFYLPEGSDLCTSGFLSRIINYGIYNFTTNIEGVKYLINRANTLKDVEHIKKMADDETREVVSTTKEAMTSPNKLRPSDNIENQTIIVGFQNVTEHAGSTSLIYMLKKELSSIYNNKVVALEIDKTDFYSYGDKGMITTTTNEVKGLISRLNGINIILVDLNDCMIKDLCTMVIYLIEPSTIRLNTLMRRNKAIIASLKDKKVILNQSLLTQKEVAEFEYESGLNILYNMPPLNDRKRNAIIVDFLKKISLISESGDNNNSNRIFGLFRK